MKVCRIAESNLKEAVDPDLVEAAVHELRAAELRLGYLFRSCRPTA